MILTMVLAIPAGIGLIMLREPIIRLLFERGAFLASDTQAMMPIMIVFGLGLPFYSYVTLLTRAFHAFKDTATPVRMAAVGFVLNLSLSLMLMRIYGTLGLALSSNAAIVVQTILLQVVMSRARAGFEFRSIAAVVLRQAMAALVMGLVLWIGREGLERVLEPFPASLVAVVALIPVGAVVFFGFLWLVGTDEREAMATIWNRISRRGKL